MKVGDKVCHKKLSGIATIIDCTIHSTYDVIRDKKITRTKYIAKYPDGSVFTFFGYDIGKSVMPYKEFEQLTFFDEIEKEK